MGKNLSIEEKKNAEVEYKANKKKILKLRRERQDALYCAELKTYSDRKRYFLNRAKEKREQIDFLLERNARLRSFLKSKKYSKYKGMFAQNGVCYKMFGKIGNITTAQIKEQKV